ncbi:type I Zorya anti-phage system protein ZorC [Tolumonas osonensis]|uniref:Zorya protein ZorC EH domain-containing protein n=1 Tax=Tolumonas osonensis TaxID=675874 RepID=A0A841GKN9_9GAMM|nr:type I Zorya anti-phage system protein ZorC [Tolumonas osonensis]MBB6055360.1 hypothetical protein [Tolumonas osonensis]
MSDTALTNLQRYFERKNDYESRFSISDLIFPSLTKTNNRLIDIFDKAEIKPPPPLKKRRKAIESFKLKEELSNTDWRLVFAGLSDRYDDNPSLLDQDEYFHKVQYEVESRICHDELNRRDWLSLCFSYFGYESDTPEKNKNWCALQQYLDKGYFSIKKQQKREKEWMRIIEKYNQIFTNSAGELIAEEMINGQIDDLSGLKKIAQVPEASWLWRRIFNVILSRIFIISDDEFKMKIERLVTLGCTYVRFMDDVLSACLTRYYHASFRQNPSTLLKQSALERWGSPQLRSSQNGWLQHVDEQVCLMVRAWFAKEDLQHFFQLLKGDRGVDQARLSYWLKYANQMSFTRIVMGSDAWNDLNTDFEEFRNRNKGRLSKLTEAASHINAVIMQIGNYFFVEFSGTGNACYVYKADDAPFNAEAKWLGMNTALKLRGSPKTITWLLHNAGWQSKFDDELAKFGIRAVKHSITASQNETKPEWIGLKTKANHEIKISDKKDQEKSKIENVTISIKEKVSISLQKIGFNKYRISDFRKVGGALKVELEIKNAQADLELKRLGFKSTNSNPLLYWKS